MANGPGCGLLPLPPLPCGRRLVRAVLAARTLVMVAMPPAGLLPPGFPPILALSMPLVRGGRRPLRQAFLLVQVILLCVSVPSSMIDPHAALDSSAYMLKKDETVVQITCSTGTVVDRFGGGRDNLKVVVRLEQRRHFGAIPHTAKEAAEDAKVNSNRGVAL